MMLESIVGGYPSAAETIDYLKKVQASKYFPAASVAMLHYDYFLTLADEIKHVWGSPLSFVSVLFYLTRYLPFLDTTAMMGHYYWHNPSEVACKVMWHTASWSYIIGICIAETVLIIRTCAIWGYNKIVTGVLSTLLAFFAALSGYYVNKFLASVDFAPNPISSFRGCYTPKADDVLYVSYAVLLVNETVIVLLTLYKAAYRKDVTVSHLSYTICRDGLVFYIYLLAISVFNICIFLILPGQAGPSAAGLHRVMHSIFTARFIINIRKAAKKRSVELISRRGTQTLHHQHTLLELIQMLPPSPR